MTDAQHSVRFGWLLDFYGPLLTQKQHRVARLRWEEDLTYQEIGETLCITRQGVYDMLRKVETQLVVYEEKLGLLDRYLNMRKGILECTRLIDEGAQGEAIKACLEQMLKKEGSHGV